MSGFKYDFGYEIENFCKENCYAYQVVVEVGRLFGRSTMTQRPKMLCYVKDEIEALALKKTIEEKVAAANEVYKELLLSKVEDKENFKYVPLKYHIKIIEGFDIVLNTTQAHTTHSGKKGSIIKYLDAERKKLQFRLADTSDVDDDIAYVSRHFSNDKIYSLHIQTGYSYRLTYYDPNEKKRRQVSVGDICIVINPSFDFRVERRTKKIRSDRKYDNSLLKSCIVYEYKGKTD